MSKTGDRERQSITNRSTRVAFQLEFQVRGVYHSATAASAAAAQAPSIRKIPVTRENLVKHQRATIYPRAQVAGEMIRHGTAGGVATGAGAIYSSG